MNAHNACHSNSVSVSIIIVHTDSSDVIAKDLVAAGLVEGKNLVVGE